MKPCTLFGSGSILSTAAVLAVIVLAAIFGMGCEDAAVDEDEPDTGNLPPLYDDDDDDTTVDDDDDDDATDDDDDATDDDDDDDVVATDIEIMPSNEAMPVGTEATFDAVVTYSDDTVEWNPAGLSWSIEDELIATFESGTVTGVSGGSTMLSASFGPETGQAAIFVGPDVFAYDMLTGTFDALDRQAQSYTVDYLATKAAIATVPNDIIFHNGFAYVVDSADGGVGVTGQEKVIRIDPAAKTTQDISLTLDSPWSALVYEQMLYVTGNLSDNLAVVDLSDDSVTVIDLPADCVPTELTGANGKIYVSCSGFDLDFFTYGNEIAIYDPSSKAVSTITLGRENPGAIMATADQSTVYVICTGDYFSTFGQINRINTTTDTVDNSFDLGGALGEATLSPGGYLLVLDWKNMYVIDTLDNDTVVRDGLNPVVVGTDDSWLSDAIVHDDENLIFIAQLNYSSFLHTVEQFDATTFDHLHTYDLSSSAPGGMVSW